MKRVNIFLVLFILCFLSFPGMVRAQVPDVEWNYKNTGSQQGMIIVDSGKLVVASARQGVKVFDATGMLLKTYPMGSTDIKRVLRNTDGTYYAVGDTITDIMDYTHGWVAKLNDTFGIIWQRRRGGIHADLFSDAAISADGGIMIAGSSNSASGDLAGVSNIFPGAWNYGWLMKLSTDGQLQWTKIYGYQPDSTNVSGASHSIIKIVSLKGGGYIFGGQISNGTGEAGPIHGWKDGWVVRISETGEIIWQKTYGGNMIMALSGGTLTDEGDFIATGIGKSLNGIPNSTMHGRFYGIVAQKFKGSNGDVLWTKAIGTAINYEGQDEPCTLWYGNHTAITTDGNLVMSAYLTNSLSMMNIPAMNQQFKGASDFWILKLSAANGSLLWHKVFGGNGIDRAYTLVPTPDGGLIAGGITNSGNDDVSTPSPLPGGYTPWLAKLGPCPYTFPVTDTICKGQSYSFYDSKYDSTGIYMKNFTIANGCDSIYTLHLFVSGEKPLLTADSNVLSTGTFNSYQWLKDGTLIAGANGQSYHAIEGGIYRVVVTNERGCTDTSAAYIYIQETVNDEFLLYPVPTYDKLYLQWGKMATGADIVVLGVDGKMLFRAHATATSVEIPVTELAAGMYLLKVIVADEQIVRKFVKL